MGKQDQLQTALVQLFQQGSIALPVMFLSEYKRIGLTEEEVMLIIHIMIYQEKALEPLPSIEKIATRMSLSTDKIAKLFRKLTQEGYLEISEEINEYGLRCESYSISPLYQKLAAAMLENEVAATEDPQTYDRIFRLFEQEFGRPLSPFECEHLSQWIDQDGYAEELIEAALKEAVFCGKVSFRYIDRILLEWQRNQVHTATDAIEHAKKFRKKGLLYQANAKSKSDEESRTKKPDFSFYNWVNQE